MAAEQDGEQLPALVPVNKPLSLIPVGVKEAALDSPTFRATAVHFADQVDAVEKWLEGLVRSAAKLSQEVANLETLVQSFLSSTTPPNQLSEAILDHDYTLQALLRFGEGADDYWSHTIGGIKKTQESVVEPVKAFINSEIRPFKEARRQLDHAQKAFDTAIARYCGQTRSKEPSSLREDAFQLHESRKVYIKASMDFSVLGPQLRSALDRLLIRVFSNQWMEMKSRREGSTSAFAQIGPEMDRIRSWSQEMSQGEKTLKRQLLLARREIEDKAETGMRPSRDLDDYAASTVPYLGTGASSGHASNAAASSKQGWLFLRTVTGKPARTSWVRRWFFVKNGIFGWLVQSAKSGGVEESEKIGVLLCNTRPAFQEDRRFCFEVKTSDASILLQAETQADLTEWLSAFDSAKQKAVEEPATTDLLASSGNPSSDAAFAVSPAVAPELAAKRADGHITGFTEELHGHGFSSDSEHTPNPTPMRSSFDVTSFRKQDKEREGEGARDHASRIMQKLDIGRKSSASPQTTGAGAQRSTTGVASLISASHSAFGPPGRSTSLQIPGSAASSTLAPQTLANPPVQTNLSKTAVMVGVDRGLDLGMVDATGGVPSGLMANQWGSTNYGHVSRVERGEIGRSNEKRAMAQVSSALESRRSSDPPTSPDSMNGAKTSMQQPIPHSSANSTSTSPTRHRKTLSNGPEDPQRLRRRIADGSQDLPLYYPTSLKAHDAQFRMLFPNVSPEERVVLVFRASWNPDEQQDLPGRVFVTTAEMYFYSHHFGMVLVSGLGLDSVSEVVAEPGKQHDYLYLHFQSQAGKDDAGIIKLKTFLEPVRLLLKRLEYLSANSASDEPDDLEQVLEELVKIEKRVNLHTLDSDSVEDLSLSRRLSQLPNTQPKTSLRVDHSIYNGELGASLDGADVIRFRLPTQAINYTPSNFQMLAAEKELDVSAKALFHMMFGDKSAVSQSSYHERRADVVTQHGWMKADDHGHFRRRFEYTVGPTRRQTTVEDVQSIEVSNDHLCYMVADYKTPWHLPLPQYYRLVSKIVITHVAKSKCKLSIYTKVGWISRVRFFTGMIEAKGIHELQQDAVSLVALMTDQVQKLGSNCNTKKAIDIFGQIGQHTDAAQITSKENIPGQPPSDRVALVSLSGLLGEVFGSALASAATTLFMLFFGLGRGLFKFLSGHIMLVVLCLASFSVNLFSSAGLASDWWRDRSAANFMTRVGVKPNLSMTKSIYLKDLQDIALGSHPLDFGSDSRCSLTFQHILHQTNPDASLSSSSASNASSEHAGRLTARRLHSTRTRMGTYRHDLLVALRLVNNIERDTIQAEYENWLIDENLKCRHVNDLIDARSSGKQDGVNSTTATTGTKLDDSDDEEQKVILDPSSLKPMSLLDAPSVHGDQQLTRALYIGLGIMATTRRANGTSTPIKRTASSISTTAENISTAAKSLQRPYLPTPLESLLLALFPLTLLLGSLFSHLSPSLSPPINLSTYSPSHQAYHPPESAPSYFATKRNVFNVYFVKIGWFWATVALAAFTLLAARGRAGVDSGLGHFLLGDKADPSLTASPRLQDLEPVPRREERDARLRRRYQVLLRYALCTLLWFLTTQWAFGAPLVDRGFSLTGGACTPSSRTSIAHAATIDDVHTSSHCKRVGGRWRGGWDISGHVFILVLGSGMLWLEMLPVMLPWVKGLAGGRVINVSAHEGALVDTRSATVEDSDEAPLIHSSPPSSGTPSHGYNTRRAQRSSQPPPMHLRRSYGTVLALSVATLSWWMLLMTAAFFHTWTEKVGGLLLAAGGLWAVYVLPRGWRAGRGILGMPGV
ncbi:MAG: SNF1-interacting protein [Chrysothrix sp. TS-e1954]|nr:MAG: SNF1-interacting protein [Chrysothrix sp. TS-e1954]